MVGFGKKRSGFQSVPDRIAATNSSIKFEVTPKPMKMLLGIVFFGAGALVFAGQMLDTRGVIINGLIELGPLGADIFYAILIGICIVFIALATFALLKSFGDKTFVTIDSQSITGPIRYGGSSLVRISFTSVRDVNVSRVNNTEFLVITDIDGSKIKVGQANFRASSDWPLFLSELRLRLGRN
jgi:hypothetical protein